MAYLTLPLPLNPLQVDQLFSILCRVLKSEIRCPDDLKKKIQEAPIIPKPDVEDLFYIWDWRQYIQPKLSGRPLQNHSFYHSFLLKKTDGIVVFRAKQYTQTPEWGKGIKLLKDGFESSPVPASDFRLESLNMDKVFSDLYTKYFPTLTLQDRQEAEASWERLRTVLESLPKKQANLPPLKLSGLPRQVPLVPTLAPSYLQLLEDREVPDLEGESYIPEPALGQFDLEIRSGMDVAVFTHSVKDRPWLGRVLSVEKESSRFEVQWFKKKGRSMTFEAQFNKDGTKYKSLLPLETVMLWEFATTKTEDSFEVSKDWLVKIMEEYSSHDECYT